MKNSARGELVEPCELSAYAVNTSSQKTWNKGRYLDLLRAKMIALLAPKGERECE